MQGCKVELKLKLFSSRKVTKTIKLFPEAAAEKVECGSVELSVVLDRHPARQHNETPSGPRASAQFHLEMFVF